MKFSVQVLSVLMLLFPTQELKFSDYLELFIEGNKEIPKEFIERYLDFGCTINCPPIIAKKLLFERPDKTMMVYQRECSAGGYCQQENIIIYNAEEQLIGHFPYYHEMADCGLEEKEVAQLVSDTLLIISEIVSEVECETEAVMGVKATLKEIDISKPLFKERILHIDTRREHWKYSIEVLSDSLLQSWSKEKADYVRNEIYAANGYKFNSKNWQLKFENQDWYLETPEKEVTLSIIEKINIDKLVKEN